MTTGEISRRLGVPRSRVSYAIERAGIVPVQRVGNVRVFSIEQWPEIVQAINSVGNHRRREMRTA